VCANVEQKHQRMSALINRCCWIGWIGGTILIVLSWVEIVSVETGWIGFGLATAGALLSHFSNAVAPLYTDERCGSDLEDNEAENY
jgi:hypothetical protein